MVNRSQNYSWALKIPRIFLLFMNFFLIIASYYVVKSLRSAMVIQSLGSDVLPYVWILSVLALTALVGVYNKLTEKVSRFNLIVITSLFFIATLGMIRGLLSIEATWLTIVFYIWGDIYSVVMVEQFWSFMREVFNERLARKHYAIIGTGGILGGATGGGIVATLLPSIGAPNMAFLCMGIIVLVIGAFYLVHISNVAHAAAGHKPARKAKKPKKQSHAVPSQWADFKMLFRSRYLFLIAATLVLTQTASTFIDFQFNQAVEATFTDLESKGIFFGSFYVLLNLASVFLMLFVAFPIHRFVSSFAGLLILPAVHILIAALFIIFPLAFVVFAMKLMDKSLHYSVQRASREQLYIRTRRSETFKVKAIIDMLGYRTSKVFASFLIIPVTKLGGADWLMTGTLFLMIVLTVTIFELYREHVQRKPSSRRAKLKTAHVRRTSR